jgi:erythrocyte band 7 integral membrane protein
LQDLLYKRQEVNEKIEEFVRQESAEWGLYVEYLLLKDMVLSNYLSENLSKVSKTKRLVESKIISAKADLESAKLYREAADILDIDAAMQIRFLETL